MQLAAPDTLVTHYEYLAIFTYLDPYTGRELSPELLRWHSQERVPDEELVHEATQRIDQARLSVWFRVQSVSVTECRKTVIAEVKA